MPQAAQIAVPAPNPNEWWTADEPNRPDAFDPLGNRRWNERDARTRRGFDNGVDASLYRLWGLQPLHGLSLRRGETVYELWYRPTDSTRQAVIRVILRADGETFVQARAGRGCCAPEVSRRVDVNAELTGDQRRALARLRDDPTWTQPRHVVVSEGGTVLSSVCVDGASYDLTLLTDQRAVHLRRSCDPAEIGSVANLIAGLVSAARGHDPRLDVVFSDSSIAKAAQSYAQLREVGGELQPAKPEDAYSPPPPAPDEQDEARAAILAADRAFAARAASATPAQAFREFMDPEDGLVFRSNGEPAEGADAIAALMAGSGAGGGKLLWEPVEAWASDAGDFGASWGRSRFVPDGAAQPVRAARYLTVWRKSPDGTWKGLMEMDAPAVDLLASPEPAAAATGTPLSTVARPPVSAPVQRSAPGGSR